ncbi:MAG: aminotransferase class III-fold pyridoxal phosphate-dependent enzyme [Microvirga sp.]
MAAWRQREQLAPHGPIDPSAHDPRHSTLRTLSFAPGTGSSTGKHLRLCQSNPRFWRYRGSVNVVKFAIRLFEPAPAYCLRSFWSMTCAIIPFAKPAPLATSNRHRKNRAAGVPVAIANQASPLEASEGLIAPAGRRPPTPARRRFGPDDPAGARAPVAEELVRLAPEGFGHAVLVGSHADAIDLAAGLCRAYHRARGEPERTGIVARDGDGAALSPIARLRHTGLSKNRFTRGQPAEGKTRAEDLRRAVSRSGARIAACLVEPLAVNAGVLVPPQGYLDDLRAICDANGLLLAFDEAAGFGHTGTAFAGQSLGVVPDVIVLGAAIANGAHSCGAVLVRSEIGATILSSPEVAPILHGGAVAPPEASAAVATTLDLFRRERLFARAARLAPVFLDAVFSLSDLGVIADIRGYGMLAAIDFVPTRSAGVRGREMQARLEAAGIGVEIRGDTAILAPALTIEERQITRMAAVLREVLSWPNLAAQARRRLARPASAEFLRQGQAIR